MNASSAKLIQRELERKKLQQEQMRVSAEDSPAIMDELSPTSTGTDTTDTSSKSGKKRRNYIDVKLYHCVKQKIKILVFGSRCGTSDEQRAFGSRDNSIQLFCKNRLPIQVESLTPGRRTSFYQLGVYSRDELVLFFH
eukprot:CAMPEP_0116543764 /NCGR_PEP_ID=MMETSP0397-20121206/1746_1 /TAXON_ID=216820 /ORGANISM="Cyclophora tenuis, Strain ECT3854" /LENGTH=137 /DNA_ID=CAMNT_0004067907 /DNA_START=552 /DNA_END=965 /DNA_ORIENTATION=-